MRFLPFSDLKGYSKGDAKADWIAAITVIFMAVPQGIAYAMIADLPPAMGLYAAAIPTIIGSILGFALVCVPLEQIRWWNCIEIASSWVLTPIIAMFVAYTL